MVNLIIRGKVRLLLCGVHIFDGPTCVNRHTAIKTDLFWERKEAGQY
jgi:hypothetical protein